MGILTPRITRQRVLGATAVLVIAIVLAYLAGVDMSAFGVGVLFGLIIVGIVVAVMTYAARRGSDQ